MRVTKNEKNGADKSSKQTPTVIAQTVEEKRALAQVIELYGNYRQLAPMYNGEDAAKFRKYAEDCCDDYLRSTANDHSFFEELGFVVV